MLSRKGSYILLAVVGESIILKLFGISMYSSDRSAARQRGDVRRGLEGPPVEDASQPAWSVEMGGRWHLSHWPCKR